MTATQIKIERYIHIANGGRIPASALHSEAIAAGRLDIAERLADVCSGRYLRYSGEDDDTLSSCWAALGWPRNGEVGR